MHNASRFAKMSTLVSSLGVMIFLIFGNQLASVFNVEVFKLTYQFLLIVVLGGGIAYLYKEIERERTEKRLTHDRLRQVHTELLRTYHDTKAIRRRLRARSIISLNTDKDGEFVLAKEYDEEIQALIEAQLTFEAYLRRAEHSLWPELSELKQSLENVQEYLGSLVKEYEDELRYFDGDPKCRKLSSLPRLSAFVGHAKDPGGFKSFSKSLQETLTSLEKKL